MDMKLTFEENKLKRGFVSIEKANIEASKNTLNTIVALARKNAIKNVDEEFIIRKRFTINNIQFEKTEATDLKDMVVKIGATERISYMALHETGGIRKPKSGNKLAIAHTYNARSSRRHLIDKSLRMRKLSRNRIMHDRSTRNYTSYKSHLVARSYMAQKLNKPLLRSEGVYAISNFHKPSRDNISFRSNMIYNKKHSSVTIDKTPWLKPSLKKPIEDAQNIYNSQVNKLLKGDII